MGKPTKEEQALTVTGEVTSLPVPKTFEVATLVQKNINVNIPKENLPEEFRSLDFETIDMSLKPTVKWSKPGQYIGGVYNHTEEGVGPNKSNLYHFTQKGFDFAVWGCTMIDKIFNTGRIKKGDTVLIIFAGEIETDQNPCKMFDVRVKSK